MSDIMVHKVTLSSGKVVLIRDLKIKDQDMAIQAAAQRAGSENQMALAAAMQKEMLKMLIVKVDEKAVKPIELEDLDSLFSYQEYMQLSQVLNKLTGGDEKMGNFKTELVTSGAQ